MKTNYSYSTSLPAYHDNPAEKLKQAELIKQLIRKGHCCLLQLSEAANLPQSSVSGRVNDLIDAGEAKYEGKVVYKNYTRKKIVLVQKGQEQPSLF